MIRWPDLRIGRKTPNGQSQLIDMGNGRVLSAEDVLEGHFHRLATKTVQVQIKPDLQAALTVLAPGLAPLTEVAAEVAQAMPPIQPADQFRRDLHRALELTHRQQMAQRKLGTRSAEERADSWKLILVVASAVVFLIGSLIYRQNLRRGYSFNT